MMKFAAASLLAFAALAVAQNDPSINSPASVVQCQPVQLSWSASKGPVYVSVIPGGQPGAAALHDFGLQPEGATTLTWVVDQPAGTDITIQIKDKNGAVAYSATTPIQNSSDSSCLKGGSSAPAQPAPGTTGASSSSSTQAPPPATTPAGTPPAGTSASSGNASTRPPATATSVPTPSSTNAPAANGALPIAQAGWTGLMGLMAALIVA
ncbi:hypothetical protein RHS03_07332, partial [Rhizoctonia solani]